MKTPVGRALLSALLFSYIAAQCQNGGYKAKGCICPGSFYGPSCEFFVDGIPAVKSLETSIRVKIQITNWNLTERLTDPQTEDFKKFEENFKAEMKNFYSKVPGYTDTKILSVMTNGAMVEHEVIAEIKFRGDRVLAQKYHKIFQQVKTRLEDLKKQHCTSKDNTTSLCVGDSITVTPIHPPSGHDFCRSIVPIGFSDLYSSYFSSEGLNCVSPCHKKSPNYLDCREGRCRLSRTGPQCLCPRTDLYIYISSDCSTRILRPSLYVTSTGAIIAISLLIFVILRIVKRIKNKVVLPTKVVSYIRL